MMTELLVLRGSTNGSTTTGTVPLDSDLFQSTVTSFRLPRGLKAKVWFKKVSGEDETLFTLQYTYDVTAATPTWKDIENEKLGAKGEIATEKRRPLILRSFTGKEAIRITWTQATAALAYVELGVELSEDED